MVTLFAFVLLADIAAPAPSSTARPSTSAGLTSTATAPTTAAPTVPTAPAAPPTSAPLARRTTALMAPFAGRLAATASSTWTGWPADRVIDGDPDTSWFSESGDAAALGKKPWIAVTFPVDVTVKKVTILGNREPSWPAGFTIRYGMLELLDHTGAVLASIKNEGQNTLADVRFVLKVPVARVRTVRFTSLHDEGDTTPFQDIALAEVLVE